MALNCQDFRKITMIKKNKNPISNSQNLGREVLHGFSNLFILNGTASMNFSHPAGVNCTEVSYKCCLGPRYKPFLCRTAYTSLLEKCLYSSTNLNSC